MSLKIRPTNIEVEYHTIAEVFDFKRIKICSGFLIKILEYHQMCMDLDHKFVTAALNNIGFVYRRRNNMNFLSFNFNNR